MSRKRHRRAPPTRRTVGRLRTDAGRASRRPRRRRRGYDEGAVRLDLGRISESVPNPDLAAQRGGAGVGLPSNAAGARERLRRLDGGGRHRDADHVRVSIWYAGSRGSVTRTVCALMRVRCAWLKRGRTTLFQPVEVPLERGRRRERAFARAGVGAPFSALSTSASPGRARARTRPRRRVVLERRLGRRRGASSARCAGTRRPRRPASHGRERGGCASGRARARA